MKDQIFDDKSISNSGLLDESGDIRSFSFSEQVSLVFDDMVTRSVPGYDYAQDLTASLVNTLKLSSADRIYDLGCSTGTSLLKTANLFLDKGFSPKSLGPKLIGLDSSQAMIKRANEKAQALGLSAYTNFIEADICDYPLEKASLIISHYTIQFIDPSQRAQILKRIYTSLLPGGYFIFSEKVYHEDKNFEELITKHYYEFKERNGYSQTEIMRKRTALENVLRPYTTEMNIEKLKEAGFRHVDIVSKELCFVTFVGRK